MIQSRRRCLHDVKWSNEVNASLWLDKYITAQIGRDEGIASDEETPQAQLVREMAQIHEPEAYKRFYEDRWLPNFKSAGATTKIAEAMGRIAIDLGSESVLETSVCLHRVYGVPYLPGSALKGLAAHYAHNELDEKWDEDSEAYRIMFGSTADAGYVNFYDALYVPGSGHDGQALWPDIITVHHPDYYRGKNVPPADWDSPTPIPFLSATGDFLIALSGPDEWVETAFKFLSLALKELGIGAKTSSGYGRMLLGEKAQKQREESYAVVKLRLLKEEVPPSGRERSEIREIYKDGAFGFMDSPTGGDDIYIKPEFLRGDIQHLEAGQIVEYDREVTNKGLQAINAEVLLEPED